MIQLVYGLDTSPAEGTDQGCDQSTRIVVILSFLLSMGKGGPDTGSRVQVTAALRLP